MGKYGTRAKPETPKVNREVHPVMRGIGCLMMVIVPIISYGISIILVNNFPLPLPPEMTTAIDLPGWVYTLNGLAFVFSYIENQPLLIAYIIFTALVSILIFTIMSIVYGFIYKAFGPSQYGSTDAPPIRKKVKKYTR
jgi:hypothetical protein